jgi:hypothetical protein
MTSPPVNMPTDGVQKQHKAPAPREGSRGLVCQLP